MAGNALFAAQGTGSGAFEDIKGTLEGEVRTRLAREELERNIQEAKVSFREEILEQAALEALGAN